jgi:hypothetical protein
MVLSTVGAYMTGWASRPASRRDQKLQGGHAMSNPLRRPRYGHDEQERLDDRTTEAQ